jgi:hypothetical protein
MHAGIRQTCLFAVVALGLVVAFAGTTFAQPGSSNLGTWKLNLEKSTLSPGTAPKSASFTIEAAGTGIKVTSDSVSADGTVRHSEFAANYDGQDNPITGTNLTNDAVALTRVDANTTGVVYKNGGKVTVTMTSVVSSDGKTVTFGAKGTNSLGETINTVAVYDKQ